MRPGRSEVAEPLAVAVPPGVVQAGPGTASRPPSPPLPAPPAGDLTRGAGRGQRRGAGPATVRGPGRSERGPSRRRHGHRGPGEAANVRGRQGHRRADQRRRCARWAGARALGRAGDTAGGGSPCPSAPPGAPAPLGRDAGGARRPALQPAPPVPLILAPCGSPCRRRRPPGSPPDALEPPADVPRATTSAPRLRPSGVCLRGRGGRDTRGWRRHTGALAPPPPCRPPAPRPSFRAARARTPFPGAPDARRCPGLGRSPTRRPGSPALPGSHTLPGAVMVPRTSDAAPLPSPPPPRLAGLGLAGGPRTALLSGASVGTRAGSGEVRWLGFGEFSRAQTCAHSFVQGKPAVLVACSVGWGGSPRRGLVWS